MRGNGKKRFVRRQPKQQRARQTVEAVLDAVVKILKRDGIDAVTTNRIAEVAGISIGSLYQYFPDKRAIFHALHDRHVEDIGRVVERTVIEHASSSLEQTLRALVDAMIQAHASDPELYELLLTEVPHRNTGVRQAESRLRGALRLALSSRTRELGSRRDIEKALFVLTHMIDALVHGVVLRRPANLSVSAAKEEAMLAVVAYLRA